MMSLRQASLPDALADKALARSLLPTGPESLGRQGVAWLGWGLSARPLHGASLCDCFSNTREQV